MVVSCRGRIVVLAIVGSGSFQFGSQHFSGWGPVYARGHEDREGDGQAGQTTRVFAFMRILLCVL